MDKVAEHFSDWLFKLSMVNLSVILGINWITEYNVNIAATIIGTVMAVLFGYWRIKTQKLLAERTREEIKLTKLANKHSEDELNKREKDEDNN